MRTPLSRAKSSSIPQAVNLAPCDPRFTDLVNEAQSRLALAGKWWGTYRRIRICVTSGCVTWPEDVLNVEGLLACGEGIAIRNEWYEFLQEVKAPDPKDANAERELLDRGIFPQFRDFTGASKVRLYASVAADAGKRVLLQGLDVNGNVIRTNDPTEGWIDGEYVTLVAPAGYAESVNTFAGPSLTGVQKDLTANRVTATAVNVSTGLETQVAVWSAGTTVPEYRRTFLVRMPRKCDESGCGTEGNGCTPDDASCSNVTIEALVRLKLVPARADSDWLFIQNLGAIKDEMRAIQLEDANQLQLAEGFHQRAIRQLRQELEAYSPAERASVGVSLFGPAGLQRVFGGFR